MVTTIAQDQINELPENLAELLMAADLFQLARLKYAPSQPTKRPQTR
jgi:hypothetical protein